MRFVVDKLFDCSDILEADCVIADPSCICGKCFVTERLSSAVIIVTPRILTVVERFVPTKGSGLVMERFLLLSAKITGLASVFGEVIGFRLRLCMI